MNPEILLEIPRNLHTYGFISSRFVTAPVLLPLFYYLPRIAHAPSGLVMPPFSIREAPRHFSGVKTGLFKAPDHFLFPDGRFLLRGGPAGWR
jgi:hypothetical protein